LLSGKIRLIILAKTRQILDIINRTRRLRAKYPSQFWLIFWGMLISTIGSSMIWPFLMIYVSGRLHLPMATIASLMTFNAVAGLIFSFVAGPAADRFGRKWIMVISLVGNGVAYLFLGQAATFLAFAILMSFSGALNPLYRVGADAMLADMIPAEGRPEAYALIRMSNNLGVALGPAIGGFIATSSFTIAFILAAVGLITYGLLLTFFGRETLPPTEANSRPVKEPLGGYGRILRDGRLVAFTLNFTLTSICAAMMWVLLSVYTNTYFGLPESLYGLIPTTNAIMVVTLQLAVTNLTKRRPPLSMLALGTLFYAAGVGSVALGRGFWGFWLSMVILSIGELILVPTATTYVASLAPPEMRGRYMGIYSLSWGIAFGIGPVLGGILNDNVAPVAIWLGGLLIGLVSAASFYLLTPRITKAFEAAISD
jgi:MFS family permease